MSFIRSFLSISFWALGSLSLAVQSEAQVNPTEQEWKPPVFLAIGSSMFVGKMNNCLAERLEHYGYDANVAGFCGLNTRVLSRGSRYPCAAAKYTGEALVSEISKTLPYRKKPKNGVSLQHKGTKLVNRKGELLINHLITELKPDHLVFFLGGNEASYKPRRSLKTEAKREKYRKRLRSRIHADELLSKLDPSVPCTWVTGTWVSKVNPTYGKTNEEVVEVAKVMTEKAGDRCSMIYGTEVMGKKEVRTFDGLHLNRKEACEFGYRVADRLNAQFVAGLAAELATKVEGQFGWTEDSVAVRGSLPHFPQR